MRTTRTRNSRTAATVGALAILAGVLILPAPVSASGGGGCGQPVTDEAGSAVDIRDYCFSPTIIRVAPGDEVRFTNRDRAPHSVLGANGSWGSFDNVKRGPAKGVTLRFTENGVFPYVCTYHVGMVGVVVVGDGVGGAIDTTTAEGPVIRVASTQSALADANDLEDATPAGATIPANGTAWPVIVGAMAAVLAVAAGAAVVRRRRRRTAMA